MIAAACRVGRLLLKVAGCADTGDGASANSLIVPALGSTSFAEEAAAYAELAIEVPVPRSFLRARS